MSIANMLANQDSGFNIANNIVLEDLQKALTVGYGTDSSTFESARALTPESLDTTLVSVLWNQDEAKLFKALKKEAVSSTVHEYNKRDDVGNGDGAWVTEGGESEEKDQNIFRRTINMKYLQTLRKVTIQASVAKTVIEAEAIEENAGALWIVRQIEKALFNGDSSCVAEEPDGLNIQITGDNVIDMRGQSALSSDFENKLTEATRKIRQSYGKADMFFSSTLVMADIQALLRDRIRVPVSANAGGPAPSSSGGNSGNYVFDVYPTKFGKPILEDNVFINEGDIPVASSITDKRPDQPSIAVVGQAVTDGRVSQFGDDDAGAYYFQVVAENRYGQSVASAAVQATIEAGEEAKITVTDGSAVGTCFRVFRSKVEAADGTDCREMFRIARTGAGQEIFDINADLPGTSSAYILTMDQMYNAIEWNQFLPMMKFPLYPTNAAVIPFLIMLFGALNVKKEEQMARVKNIAPSDLGWF